MVDQQANLLKGKERAAGRLETSITILLLLYFTDGLDAFGIVEQLIAAASYIVIPFLALRNWKRFAFFATRDIALICLVFLALASILWSDSPSSTIANGRALIRITMFAIYFAMRYSLKDQLRLTAIALGISAFLSLLLGIVIPSTGINATNWKGGFPHKNYLARTMVISTAVSLLVALDSKRRKWLPAAALLISFLLILLSQGKTALVQFLFLITVLMPFCRVLRQHYLLRVPLLTVFLPAIFAGAVWFSQNFERIAVDVFSKNDSLAGRERLAEVLWNKFFWEKPWLGHGYFGFWTSQYDRVVDELVKGLYQAPWVPTHAHNGFLDTGLNLGFVGLALFLLSFIFAYQRATLLVGATKDANGLWPFLLLTFFFASNVNVNLTILSPTDMLWILYVSISTSLAVNAIRTKRMRQKLIMNEVAVT